MEGMQVNKERGHVRLYRDVGDHPALQDAKAYALYWKIAECASHFDGYEHRTKRGTIKLRTGERVWAMSKIAKFLQCSEDTAAEVRDRLVNAGLIAWKNHGWFTVFRIVNFRQIFVDDDIPAMSPDITDNQPKGANNLPVMSPDISDDQINASAASAMSPDMEINKINKIKKSKKDKRLCRRDSDGNRIDDDLLGEHEDRTECASVVTLCNMLHLPAEYGARFIELNGGKVEIGLIDTYRRKLGDEMLCKMIDLCIKRRQPSIRKTLSHLSFDFEKDGTLIPRDDFYGEWTPPADAMEVEI